MGIVAWPDGVQLGATERCVLCGKDVALADLSAGMCDLRGVQKFACNSHFKGNVRAMMVAWADFVAEQYWIHHTDKDGCTLGDFTNV